MKSNAGPPFGMESSASSTSAPRVMHAGIKRDVEDKPRLEDVAGAERTKRARVHVDSEQSSVSHMDTLNEVDAPIGQDSAVAPSAVQSLDEPSQSQGVTRRDAPLKPRVKVSRLPIHDCEADLLRLVKQNQVCVITGDTGSGKSTQLAQILYRAGLAQRGVIGVTQPRRIGAVSVAKRVADELGVNLGDEVGYVIRFEDCTSSKTRIQFVTDGTMLRQCLDHPNLEPYSVVVLDEAHERGLQTDILFGILNRAMAARPELKVIITSATLDVDKFSRYFSLCPTYHVPGRCYPVDIQYIPPPQISQTEQSLIAKEQASGISQSTTTAGNSAAGAPSGIPQQAAAPLGSAQAVRLLDWQPSELVQQMGVDLQFTVDIVTDLHATQPAGHILVFLTGQEEIEKACKVRVCCRQSMVAG